MLKRFLTLLIALPAAIVLITLFVANRHDVQMVLDPFQPESPALAFSAPFYMFLFGSLLLGVVLGGISVWLGQSHWRQMARKRSQEARRWQAEADRLQRERDATVAAQAGATPPRQLIAS